MSKAIYSLMALLLLGASMNLSAQRGYRDYLRGGDKHYTDSLYEKSEIQYRKALEKDANGVNAFYNLGNSLLMQSKAKDAMDQYKIVEKKVDEAGKLAQIHHNMGVIYHGSKDYAAAVESYKQSLRENPNDDETRYNLALAMRKLKEQQQQQQQQEQKQQQQQEQQQQEQQQQEQQQQEQQQQEQQQQEQQQQKEQQQQEQQMSKENAEQILQAAMQDEKDVQEKVKKMMQLRGRKLEKDW
jgi:tetratricopeptide (TPR) repeat protein